MFLRRRKSCSTSPLCPLHTSVIKWTVLSTQSTEAKYLCHYFQVTSESAETRTLISPSSAPSFVPAVESDKQVTSTYRNHTLKPPSRLSSALSTSAGWFPAAFPDTPSNQASPSSKSNDILNILRKSSPSRWPTTKHIHAGINETCLS